MIEFAPGTPMFAPRDVLHHNKEHNDSLTIDPTLDIFSFGAVVYFLLTGSPLPVDAAVLLNKGFFFLLFSRKYVISSLDLIPVLSNPLLDYFILSLISRKTIDLSCSLRCIIDACRFFLQRKSF